MAMNTLRSESLRAVVDPDQGADLTELCYVPTQTQVLWSCLKGEAAYLSSEMDETEADFYRRYRGGMQEMLPNGGARYQGGECDVGFHGEAWSRRWDVVDDGGAGRAVVCSVELNSVPLRVWKRYSLKGETLRVESRLVNVSDEEVRFIWGFHPAFGSDVTEPAAWLVFGSGQVLSHPAKFGETQHFAPGTRSAYRDFVMGLSGGKYMDRIPLFGGDEGSSDLLYAVHAEPRCEIVNWANGIRVGVAWDGTAFPHLWLWQECRCPTTIPWFGKFHIVGVEPCSAYPSLGLGGAIANGSASCIGPRGEKTAWLEISVGRLND